MQRILTNPSLRVRLHVGSQGPSSTARVLTAVTATVTVPPLWSRRALAGTTAWWRSVHWRRDAGGGGFPLPPPPPQDAEHVNDRYGHPKAGVSHGQVGKSASLSSFALVGVVRAREFLAVHGQGAAEDGREKEGGKG